ncbi:MAG: hypothetical protein U9Q94_04610 [Candidatus Bipolaricaulota bacterium]|nr:hypothetical protein [Candidatus Bipolaricaulota bacterium]
MLQVAGDPKEVADLILHDATFSPQELVFRDGRVEIEGIKRWGWEETVTTEEGKIEMPRMWARLIIENAIHLRVDYDTYAPLVQDVRILWLECEESEIVQISRDGEKKTVYDIRILGFPATYTVSVVEIDVRLEDVDQEREVIDLDNLGERDLKIFLTQFEQPIGYRGETEYKRSRFAVGDQVRWGGRGWRVRAIYPSYTGKSDADHTFYYKLEGRGNRFYEEEIEPDKG